MLFSCPNCKMSLKSDPSMAGQSVHCPSCNQRIIVPQDISGGPTARTRGGWPESDPSNVNTWIAMCYALGAMVITVGILYTVRESFVGHIFFSGGWVTFTEVFFYLWGLALIFLKYRKNRIQRDALLLDVLPKGLGVTIDASNVDRFIDHVYALPSHLRDSMMVSRIRKGLELFELRGSNSEVAEIISAQSDVDANRTMGSYSLLKVFLWSMPILGFIGTVLGLSVAMAGFGATDLTDINALKASVGAITNGLSEAFHTTMVGLMLSMLLIFPMSAMQKREEDTLTDVDAFCNANILPRLRGSEPSHGKHQGHSMSDPEAHTEMLSRLTEAQQQLVEDIRTVAATVNEAAASLESRSQQHQQFVEGQFASMLQSITTSASDSISTTSATTENYIKTLADGIGSLNRALATLGEKQIVLQLPEPPPKRGWFGRKAK